MDLQAGPAQAPRIPPIVYINLDRRTDRREQIESELQRMGLSGERFAAIEHASGIVGCGMSHLAVLERARTAGWESVLILEDDFQFIVDKATFERQMAAFLESGLPYDVIMLSYHQGKQEPFNEVVSKALETQTTAGYLVHRRFYDTLIDTWREGLSKLVETGEHWTYALDQYWKKLQPGAQWFCLIPRIGCQRPGYSDLAGRHVDYGL
jgi:glycosyl transferase family 25